MNDVLTDIENYLRAKPADHSFAGILQRAHDNIEGQNALLAAIVRELDGVEWDPDTTSNIAQLLIDYGFRIRDCNEVES